MLRLPIVLCCFFPLFVCAQSAGSRQLIGQVVEMTHGQETGVPKLTVSIADFAWDITDERGYFKLPLPAGRDFVTINLEGTPMKMLSPYEGLVNLPPDGPFRIIVCGAENRRLTQKVTELNGRIARIEKEKQLSVRQVAGMRKILLDTILYYESRISALDESLQRAETLTTALNTRDARTRALEDSVEVLEKALGEALQQKFLHQKEQYEQVAAELLKYCDRLKDLRDRATPDQLPLFFRSQQASDQLNETIGRYNAARTTILDQSQAHVLTVRQYWANATVAEQLESAYRFLLTEVHQAWVLPLDAQVFGEVRKLEAKQSSRPRAEKNAARAAGELVPGLNDAIRQLELAIDTALNAMAENI